MPRLRLLRHAHASNDADSDFERPLSQRGRDEARRVGERLAGEGAAPGLVLCSASLRTRETLAGLEDAGAVADGAERRFDEALYLASARQILDALRDLSPGDDDVLVVAHNPGIHELAVALAGEGDRDAYDALRAGMKPAALCTLEVASWPDLAPGAARLTAFERA